MLDPTLEPYNESFLCLSPGFNTKLHKAVTLHKMPDDGYKKNSTKFSDKNKLAADPTPTTRLTVTNFQKVENETTRLQTGGYKSAKINKQSCFKRFHLKRLHLKRFYLQFNFFSENALKMVD